MVQMKSREASDWKLSILFTTVAHNCHIKYKLLTSNTKSRHQKVNVFFDEVLDCKLYRALFFFISIECSTYLGINQDNRGPSTTSSSQEASSIKSTKSVKIYRV